MKNQPGSTWGVPLTETALAQQSALLQQPPAWPREFSPPHSSTQVPQRPAGPSVTRQCPKPGPVRPRSQLWPSPPSAWPVLAALLHPDFRHSPEPVHLRFPLSGTVFLQTPRPPPFTWVSLRLSQSTLWKALPPPCPPPLPCLALFRLLPSHTCCPLLLFSLSSTVNDPRGQMLLSVLFPAVPRSLD